MNLIRRTRGTPEPKVKQTFWNLVKSGLTVTGAIGSITHPAFAVLSIGAEAIDQVQNHVISRRSRELLEDIADDIQLANQDGKLTIEQIQQVISSEQFNSALLQARFIAARTHQEEKLAALRAAVLNVVLGKKPDADRQQQFLALVDRFTGLHLSLLRYLADPPGYFRVRGEEVPTVTFGGDILAVDHLVEIVSGERPTFIMQHQETASSQFVALIVADLTAAQLIHLHRIGDQWVMPYRSAPRPELSSATTQLGKDFITFITAPGGTNGD